MGRFAFPVFRYTKLLGERPDEISLKVAAIVNDELNSRSADGPLLKCVGIKGYINASVDFAALAEETKNPGRNLPLGMILSLTITSVFYALDPMIWPPANAILPYPEARNHFIRKIGHAQPLYCSRAAQIAISEFYGQPAEGQGPVGGNR